MARRNRNQEQKRGKNHRKLLQRQEGRSRSQITAVKLRSRAKIRFVAPKASAMTIEEQRAIVAEQMDGFPC